MEVSILKHIQDTVIKYANVISTIIKVEVEIVDKNLIRIAGTGIYKNRINENISKKGYIYKHTLTTGENHIVKNPGAHYLCEECVDKDCCIEKMQVCNPIKLNNEIIGVIGLICSNEDQKEHLIRNLDFYLEFLSQIGEFISAKAYEYSENKRDQMMVEVLKQVIDSVDKGVLIINNNSEIVHMNSSAMKQLKLTAAHLNKVIDINATSEYIMGGEMYTINVDGRKINLMGRLIPVYPILGEYDKIFIFNELKKVKTEIYETAYAWKPIKTEDIAGTSRAMTLLKDKIKKVASSKSTVLITGESGTGKELIARAVHSESDRNGKPFIAINCGAIPDTLLESELFGYVRGAFSGADPGGRIGKFELANKGTIFLDEIGDMPLYLQVKLLRVLQERKIARIGSNQLIELDIRVIAATNKDIRKLISENKFREDLYYRLNVIPMEIPPLRARREDIEPIAMNMVEKYNKLFDKSVHSVESQAKQTLINYYWPGNVRELENTIEFMINMADESGVLKLEMLPQNIVDYENAEDSEQNQENVIRKLKDIEKEYILKAIEIYGDDTKGKQAAAKQLGIGIATLYRKLEGIK